ncbi:hypothetical protein SDC9_114339 [bioreactor metagenome]|uniref:Uncharacterized protein n=1 Tax=bioreactor metagenome TaxID=1076179 RepID=A0A645BQ84_9ZZZZ
MTNLDRLPLRIVEPGSKKILEMPLLLRIGPEFPAGFRQRDALHRRHLMVPARVLTQQFDFTMKRPRRLDRDLADRIGGIIGCRLAQQRLRLSVGCGQAGQRRHRRQPDLFVRIGHRRFQLFQRPGLLLLKHQIERITPDFRVGAVEIASRFSRIRRHRRPKLPPQCDRVRPRGNNAPGHDSGAQSAGDSNSHHKNSLFTMITMRL